ncbi:carboxypeptidase-like regulatory domain-containing protein [Lutibacter sp.]|uniref:carboxypeptidase-like regulatory domain-containing protein n=1 Tax=Lutibacter sp. TaxID=1925666 RepID=UPI002735F4EE|nr:carboxypeptidase-like regulatory domain-containing protein [Lutibacter sp.]
MFQNYSYAKNVILNDTIGVQRVKGLVVDSKTKTPLVFASISVNGTNISTVTNSNGEFTLKVPKKYQNELITFSFLGYTSKVLIFKDLKNESIIKLETYIEELEEIKITVKDAKSLILEVLKRKGSNYLNELTSMTAFYRETIKKRRAYISLSEAVLEINKQPYTSVKNDALMLYKSRKSTDYDKLDTIAFKLKGGPISTLNLDIIKNPNTFFTEEMLEVFDFSFASPTKIDNRPIYVVNFKQKKEIEDPQYYGELYIDAQALTLINAKFHLNLDDVVKASKLFIVKKPNDADVSAIEASYQVDYVVKNGKWHYSYSRIQLGFKINWSKKLFNTVYYTTSEMAITDWEIIDNSELIKPKDRMRSSIIMSDEASGFSDPDFWGTYNIIEPEKPIETAIKKIQKQLKKN